MFSVSKTELVCKASFAVVALMAFIFLAGW